MAILGLSVGVVGLGAVSMIERRQVRADIQDVRGLFREARYQAILEERTIDFGAFTRENLPGVSGVSGIITIYDNGFCSGEGAELDLADIVVTVKVDSQSCELSDVGHYRR